MREVADEVDDVVGGGRRTLVALWGSLAAKKTSEPGPACCLRPLMETSKLPCVTRRISSQEWRWMGCDSMPGLRVVTWTSSFSRVRVGLSKIWRTSPVGVGLAMRESQSTKVLARMVGSLGGA